MLFSSWVSAVHRFWRPPSSTVDKNIRLLYLEIFWSAILGGVVTFNDAFVIRLGAPNALVGLLASAPPLIVALLTIPAARLLERHADRRPYMFWGLLLNRIGYLVVALLPLFAPHQTAAWVVAGFVVLNLPVTLFNAGWMPLLADVVPEQRRAYVFSRRNIIYFAVTAAVTFVAGRWLSASAFPTNYQTLYAFGAAAALISCATLERLVVPPCDVPKREAPVRHRHVWFPAVSWDAMRNEFRNHRPFWNLTLNSLVFNFGIWMSVPLFTLFFVRELNADDGWIGLKNGLNSLAVVGGFLLAERLIRWRGFRWVLTVLGPLSPLYPFSVALLADLDLILFAVMFVSFVNPSLDLSRSNLLLKLSPRERRASYVGFWTTIMNAGAVIAPLISVALADRIGLRAGLIVAGGVRLAGALLFFVLKLDEPPAEEPALLEGAAEKTGA